MKVLSLLLATTPGAERMLGNPDHECWATLERVAESPALTPIREILERTAADDAFSDVDALMEALGRLGADVDRGALRRAGEYSQALAETDPYGAFLVAWATLAAWMLGPEEAGWSINDSFGIFDPGWGVLPYACATAAMRLGGLYGAIQLAELARETLRVAHHRGFGRRPTRPIDDALLRYSELTRRLSARQEMAVSNLADDLRDACEPGDGDLRAEVAALLWTMGRVPETYAVLRHGADALTRPLARRLVHESIRSIPEDPLVQYVWLEMKDNPRLDLREHESLFAVIDGRWDQWWLDGPPPPWGDSPSRWYAQTLVQALRGRLEMESGSRFLSMFDDLEQMDARPPTGWAVPFRLRALRMLVGAHLDLYVDGSREAIIGYLEEQVDILTGNRVQSWQYPQLPRVGARLAAPLFELLERRLGPESHGDDAIASFEALERPRAGALTYWLRTAPPLPPDNVSGDVAEGTDGDDRDVRRLLEEEASLIERLRGASFLTLKPTLPAQFQWVDLDIGTKLALDDPAQRGMFYSPERARHEMREIEAKLDRVARRLDMLQGSADTHLPEPITVEQLVGVLAAHARTP